MTGVHSWGVFINVDTYQFIAAIAGALAWPIAVLTGLVILRKPLKRALETLADRMSTLKSLAGAGVTLEFMEDELEKRQSELKEIGANGQFVQATDWLPDAKLLAEASPPAAIVQTWIAVESAINRAADRRGLSPGLALPEKLSSLSVPNEIYESVLTLRSIKNSAIHSQAFVGTTELSDRYIKTGEEVIAFLEHHTPQAEVAR